MGWLDFTAKIVSALAWLAAVVAVALLFRARLGALIDRIKKLKWRQAEIEITESLDRAEVLAEQAELPLPASTSHTNQQESDALERVIQVSPRAAIIEAWIEVRRALREAAQAHEVVMTPSATRVASDLVRHGVLTPQVVDLVKQLQDVRNEAAHAEEFHISHFDAARYLELSRRVMEALEIARTSPPRGRPRKQILVSDLSGREIPVGSGATVKITFHDPAKGGRELHVTDAEAETMGGSRVSDD